MAHYLKINSAGQRCIDDRTQGKSHLSANWDQAKSVCMQLGVVPPPAIFLSFAAVFVTKWLESASEVKGSINVVVFSPRNDSIL